MTSGFQQCNPLGIDLKSLLNSANFSDVEFLVGEEGVNFRGHRAILCVRSEVFSRMFEGGFQEGKTGSPVLIPNIAPSVFQELLSFIYTGTFKLDVSSVVALYAAADQYMVEGLKYECVVQIQAHLTPDNVLPLLEQSVDWEQQEIAEVCLKHIGKNAEQVFVSQYWNRLRAELVERIVSSNDLRVGEARVLKAVLRWGRAKVENNKSPLLPTEKEEELPEAYLSSDTESEGLSEEELKDKIRHVLGSVRLGLLSAEQLYRLVEPLCAEGLFSWQRLAQAYRHAAEPCITELEEAQARGCIPWKRDGSCNRVRIVFSEFTERMKNQGRILSPAIDLLHGCRWTIALSRSGGKGKGEWLALDVVCQLTDGNNHYSSWSVSDGGMSFGIINHRNTSRSLWRRWRRAGHPDSSPWDALHPSYGWPRFIEMQNILDPQSGFLNDNEVHVEIRVPLAVHVEHV